MVVVETKQRRVRHTYIHLPSHCYRPQNWADGTPDTVPEATVVKPEDPRPSSHGREEAAGPGVAERLHVATKRNLWTVLCVRKDGNGRRMPWMSIFGRSYIRCGRLKRWPFRLVSCFDLAGISPDTSIVLRPSLPRICVLLKLLAFAV